MGENTKLTKAKKMTKVTEVVLKISEILCSICAVTLIVVGLLMAFNAPVIVRNTEEGNGSLELKKNISVVEFSVIEIEDDELMKDMLKNAHSDVPFIQEKLEEGNTVGVVGIMLLFYGIILELVMIAIRFLRLIFTKINKAETPFAPEVIKQMKISFIVISVVLFFSTGSLVGVFAILGLWSIYFIFDYGYCLQQLEDETI